MRETTCSSIRGKPAWKAARGRWMRIPRSQPELILIPKTSPCGYSQTETCRERDDGRVPNIWGRRYIPVPS